jgi:hypothetical protein
MRRGGLGTTGSVPLSGRQRLHRQCVNLFAHAVSQCAVDDLVALHARFAFKRRCNDHRLKVRAIAINGEVFAIEFGTEITGNVFGGDHDSLGRDY